MNIPAISNQSFKGIRTDKIFTVSVWNKPEDVDLKDPIPYMWYEWPDKYNEVSTNFLRCYYGGNELQPKTLDATRISNVTPESFHYQLPSGRVAQFKFRFRLSDEEFKKVNDGIQRAAQNPNIDIEV